MTENALKGRNNGGAVPIGYEINKDGRFEIDKDGAFIVSQAH